MTPSGGFPGLALALLGAGAAAPTPAPTPVQVKLAAEAGCADGQSFFARLRARTDRVRLAEPGENALTIDVQVSRVGSKVHGELRFRQGETESATRQVDGASCEEVVGVLSLTAALALERLNAESDAANGSNALDNTSGQAGASGNVAAGAPRDAAAAQAGGAPVVNRSGTKSAPEAGTADVGARGEAWATDPSQAVGRRPLQVELGAELGLTQLLSPLLAMGVGPLVRVRHEHLSVGLSALYWSSSLTNAKSSTRLRSFGFSLSACPWSWAGRRVSFEPCLLGAVGLLHVSDSSVANPHPVDRSLWALGALGRVRLTVSPGLGLELEGGFAVPLVERRFVTEQPDRTAAETPKISPFFGLAAVVSP